MIERIEPKVLEVFYDEFESKQFSDLRKQLEIREPNSRCGICNHQWEFIQAINMPSQCLRNGNYCCRRINKSVVEGIQASPWYRNKVQPKLECNSREHYWHRPSSSGNSSTEAPVEPQQAHLANHTALAEHRHFNRQRINSKSGQSCCRKVDVKLHQLITTKKNPNRKWPRHRNSVKWHDGIGAGHTTNYKSNRIHSWNGVESSLERSECESVNQILVTVTKSSRCSTDSNSSRASGHYRVWRNKVDINYGTVDLPRDQWYQNNRSGFVLNEHLWQSSCSNSGKSNKRTTLESHQSHRDHRIQHRHLLNKRNSDYRSQQEEPQKSLISNYKRRIRKSLQQNDSSRHTIKVKDSRTIDVKQICDKCPMICNEEVNNRKEATINASFCTQLYNRIRQSISSTRTSCDPPPSDNLGKSAQTPEIFSNNSSRCQPQCKQMAIITESEVKTAHITLLDSSKEQSSTKDKVTSPVNPTVAFLHEYSVSNSKSLQCNPKQSRRSHSHCWWTYQGTNRESTEDWIVNFTRLVHSYDESLAVPQQRNWGDCYEWHQIEFMREIELCREKSSQWLNGDIGHFIVNIRDVSSLHGPFPVFILCFTV